MKHYVKIYLDKKKENFQIVQPGKGFNGDYKGLVRNILRNHYPTSSENLNFGYEIH